MCGQHNVRSTARDNTGRNTHKQHTPSTRIYMGWGISHDNYFISWIYVNRSQTYMCRVDMSVRFMSTHVVNTLSFRLYMSHFPTGLVSSKRKIVAMTFAPTYVIKISDTVELEGRDSTDDATATDQSQVTMYKYSEFTVRLGRR